MISSDHQVQKRKDTLTMQNIGEIISENRKKKGMSQVELARELNQQFGYEISNKSISKWENGFAEPSIRIFFSICRILGATDLYEAYFGMNPDNPVSLLNDLGRERVFEYASLLSKDARFQKTKRRENIIPFRTIPLQLYPVSAGPGNFLDDENYENIPVGDEVPLTADFAVRISGDSMEPLLHGNQIIYIHRQDTLENGEIGIFFLDGEAYVKKLKKDETGTYLVSLNTRYMPLKITAGSDFRVFGKMVY